MVKPSKRGDSDRRRDAVFQNTAYLHKADVQWENVELQTIDKAAGLIYWRVSDARNGTPAASGILQMEGKLSGRRITREFYAQLTRAIETGFLEHGMVEPDGPEKSSADEE